MNTGHTMSVKMLGKMLNDTGAEMEVAKKVAVDNALNSAVNFAKHSQFISAETDFLALDIRHFETHFHDEEMVNV